MERRRRGVASDATLRAELEAIELFELEEQVRLNAEDDLIFFCRHILDYRDLEDGLHGDVARIVCDTTKKMKLILLPRGHLKSSLVTVGFTLWLLCRDPNMTIAIISEASDLAEDFVREIKEHLEGNALLNHHWPKLVPAHPKVWTKDKLIVNRSLISKTASVEAMGLNEATAGRHPKVMIFDDPISNKTVTNEDQLTKSIESFRHLQALLEPPRAGDLFCGTEIVIGTRWHWQDLYSHIIEKLPDQFDIVVRAAVEDGEIIFPKKFSTEYLRAKREAVGEWVFSSQYMNNPVDPENAVFPPHLVSQRLWKGDRQMLLDRIPCIAYLTVDPAWEGEDATGIIAAARAQNGKLYILDALRVRLQPDKMLEAVVAMALRWRVRKIGFEGVAGGQEWLVKNLQDLLRDREIHVPVVALSHGNRAKHARILGIVPELQFKRLYIHESLDQLRTELVQYPRGGYVDLIDAVAMMIGLAVPPGRTRSLSAEECPGTGEFEVAMIERDAKRQEFFGTGRGHRRTRSPSRRGRR